MLRKKHEKIVRNNSHSFQQTKKETTYIFFRNNKNWSTTSYRYGHSSAHGANNISNDVYNFYFITSTFITWLNTTKNIDIVTYCEKIFYEKSLYIKNKLFILILLGMYWIFNMFTVTLAWSNIQSAKYKNIW